MTRISRTNRHGRRSAARGRRGSAMIMALMAVSMLAVLGLSMLSSGLDGARSVHQQTDEYKLVAAVESAGGLAADFLWAGYLRSQGGAPGNVASFRTYLDAFGLQHTPGEGPPAAGEGLSLLQQLQLPLANDGARMLNQVDVDSLLVVRRDEIDATHLFISVSASTRRGKGLASPELARTIQLVYTIAPDAFEGFDYGILSNNVNCVFCHTVVDNVDRYYNTDPSLFGTYDRVKVGTLESLMLRHDPRPSITDNDADSHLAGSLYVRGTATDAHGAPIGDWSTLAFKSKAFDGNGALVQDAWGDLSTTNFQPAGAPFGPGENLYLDYPLDYAAMPDGALPTHFPPPFPDDGGYDPDTGTYGPGADNRIVDPEEFQTLASVAQGSVSGGHIFATDGSNPIDTPAEFSQALFTGNASSVQQSQTGNFVLSGTQEHPLVIDGTVAIDGDVVINGYVKGTGTILASGNIYVPTDLLYADGPSTFGIAADGTKNALGLAAGGNILIGDYLKPSSSVNPGQYEVVTGDPGGAFSFVLAELSIFNRNEWAKTQPLLPGPDEDPSNPATWTVTNPTYAGSDYVPRYYQFGPDDTIPIYNKGNLWFDPSTHTWLGDEVPLSWDPDMLTLVDPTDSSSPYLFDPVSGLPIAAIHQLTPQDGWLSDAMQKAAIEYFEHNRPAGPLRIDSLLYTNNAIFGIVHRGDVMEGQLLINGSLVCADLGILAPGKKNGIVGADGNVPNSPFSEGLRLNYDARTKDMLRVVNPNRVSIRRSLWNPTANHG